MSLPSRVILLTAVLFGVGIVLFGALQLLFGTESALREIDRELLRRAVQSRGPHRGGPPRPVPTIGPPPDFDVRRPRAFFLDGRPVEARPEIRPWSQELFDRALQGAPVYGDLTVNDQTLRVISAKVDHPEFGPVVVQAATETTSLQAARTAQTQAFWLVVPLALAFAAVVGAIVSRLVMAPVRRLTSAAERLAADPTAHEEIAPRGTDEMARLGKAFDSMTHRLQDSNRQLVAALESQRRFTGDAAHELRTPLTGILLAAENGLHPEATDQERRDALASIAKSGESMGRLTQMLLTLARIDSGRQTMPLSSVGLLPLLQEAAEQAGLMDDPRLAWCGRETTVVEANPDAVRQIARNLLENAAEYTPEGGQIIVDVGRSGFTISDTGPGFAPEHLPRLFERFYRPDPSRSRERGGSGLGLAIVQSLAQAQGAIVSARSEPGHGASFEVAFPPQSSDSRITHESS
ncbi:MAG: HAMP domain-containing histidine kinase [Fimbriimonadaceae bacterium]|nr:HAMP domain-containing histidine kinase [Fimbriimonadaceae bacterium]QYK59630.1 MAG: HAMP domain-containing histidine kinase [Fimbriimonadaceae bacterium]